MSDTHLSSSIPRWATTREAATLLNKHINTIWLWLEDGTLPGIKIGGRWYVDLDAIADLFPSRKAAS